MEWHINDLSLAGQFTHPLAFWESLEPILRLRDRRPDLRSRIYCSKGLYLRPVCPGMNVHQAILSLSDPNFKRLALGWFANAGPFWEDTRACNPDDYFEFEGEDVTDQGLGEAARRLVLNIGASSFSFLNPPMNRFQQTTLEVTHGLSDDPISQIDIANFWTTADVEAAAVALPESWRGVLQLAVESMDLLLFSNEIPEQLCPYPFQMGIAQRILGLLEVLQDIATETLADSSLSDTGMLLRRNYMEGSKAWFTDESDDNKRIFRSELTFPDPTDKSSKLFCPWHGKVKIGQFRIHFEWPRPKGQRLIKVVYIGPKITKR